MATTGAGVRDTLIAAVDLSSYQWCFVKAGSVSGEVNLATGGSDPYPIGILENDPKAGEGALVCFFGKTKVSASACLPDNTGSAINIGSNLVAGPGGRAHVGTCPINAISLEALDLSTEATIDCIVLTPGATIVGTNYV